MTLGPLSSAIHRRITLNLNSIFLVVGPRGSGKSYTSMRISEMLDKTFTVDDVVFDVQGFLERLKQIQGKWKSLIFDEAGLSEAMPARLFMRELNLVMSYVAESFRHTRTHLFVTVPSQYMIDVSIRQLADFYVVMQSRGQARVYTIKMNPFRHGQIMTPVLCNIETLIPSKQLCEDYETKRASWMETLYDKWLTDVKAEGAKKPFKNVIPEAEKIYSELQDSKMEDKKIAYELADRLGISLAYAYRLKNRFEA